MTGVAFGACIAPTVNIGRVLRQLMLADIAELRTNILRFQSTLYDAG
jgi:hypothetical protein